MNKHSTTSFQTWENPLGTDGFAFVEFATLTPEILDNQFRALGFTLVAKHKRDDIVLYQQNDIRFIINKTPNSRASEFASLHGPSACAMGFCVKDAKNAYEKAIAKGARPYSSTFTQGELKLPAIYGVGGSLIYFVEKNNNKTNYDDEFIFTNDTNSTTNAGLTYLDHLTHNLYRGEMDKLAEFYQHIFNFKQIRYFDIEGKLTGLKSRAMTAPCGKIRIPLNESADDKSQIEEFLHAFKGEGIQHIALGTDNIYETVEKLHANGIEFLDTPETYYDKIDSRLPQHGEDLPRLRKNRILIDGNTEGGPKILLQIFTQNMLGPVFFEIIQRKGDEGFGEGNFTALFESIEEDQIKRGVLK